MKLRPIRKVVQAVRRSSDNLIATEAPHSTRARWEIRIRLGTKLTFDRGSCASYLPFGRPCAATRALCKHPHFPLPFRENGPLRCILHGVGSCSSSAA